MQRRPLATSLLRRPRLSSLLALGCLGYLLYTYFHRSSVPASPSLFAPDSGLDSTPGRSYEGNLPLITLVIFHDGAEIGPKVVPWFFQSVARQPRALELVIIQRGGCSDLSGRMAGASNIRHICMEDEDFWAAHVDYLCSKFRRGCTGKQRRIMLQDMLYYSILPSPQAMYPILRGWVFKKYIRPETAFWGYADFDTFLGDFSRTFPYDLLKEESYDVLIPTEPHDGPSQQLVFMRGHLTFFRNTPDTEQKLLRYEGFKSFRDWDVGFLRPQQSVGEGNYSSFVVQEPSINILTFDALSMPVLPRVSGPAGVISLPERHGLQREAEAPLALPPGLLEPLTGRSRPASPNPSFSSRGIERPIHLNKGVKLDRAIWFHHSCANWYQAESVPTTFADDGTPERWRRYVTKVNDVWTERVEPMIEYEPIKGAYEWLYVHWQEEKKQAHFDLPANTRGDVFVNYFYQGNAVYDSQTGQRTAWLSKREQSCSYAGCVEPGETPLTEQTWFKHLKAVEKETKNWYAVSKEVRMGISTATLGPNPRPTLLALPRQKKP
ncbi:hypothetical protein IAU60_001598 [Kwoniella sp. DSM 27419]